MTNQVNGINNEFGLEKEYWFTSNQIGANKSESTSDHWARISCESVLQCLFINL